MFVIPTNESFDNNVYMVYISDNNISAETSYMLSVELIKLITLNF